MYKDIRLLHALLCSLRCPIIVASKLQCLHWYLTPSCTDFLLFWLLSCFVAAMFARVFHTFMCFLPVFCKCSICSCFICAICTRKLNSFMHFFVCSLRSHIIIVSKLHCLFESFMYRLLVYFKLSLLSQFIAAMFERIYDSYINSSHWSLCNSFIISKSTRKFHGNIWDEVLVSS